MTNETMNKEANEQHEAGVMAAPCPKNVELLAPAGNMECLHAAVKAGADAVYLGAGHFNARRGADNFSLENLAEACDYAHLRGVKIYLTLNTVVLPSELPDALELARQAYRCGVDAFIVQDIGISIELSRIMPGVEVHVSTQMNIHDEDGLRAAAALGATRVTLARELSLAEIARLHELAEELGIELESFVSRRTVRLLFGPVLHVVAGRWPLRQSWPLCSGMPFAVRTAQSCSAQNP